MLLRLAFIIGFLALIDCPVRVLAQTVNINAVFQTIEVHTVPTDLRTGPCAVSLASIQSNVLVNADDSWMDCPYFEVAVPPSTAVVVSGSSSNVSVRGNYSSLAVINVNGSTNISGDMDSLYLESTNGPVEALSPLYARSGKLLLTNSYFYGAQVLIESGLVEAHNQGLNFNDFSGAPDFTLVNADVSMRRTLVKYGESLRVQGTNSNFSMGQLACGSFEPRKDIILESNLRRRTTRLKGNIKISRRSKEQGRLVVRRCGKISFRLTNGNVPGY